MKLEKRNFYHNTGVRSCWRPIQAEYQYQVNIDDKIYSESLPRKQGMYLKVQSGKNLKQEQAWVEAQWN